MTKQVLSMLCTACLVAGVQAQTTGTDRNSPGTSSGSSPGQSGSESRFDTSGSSTYHYGARGRMGHHELRASKIIGADVKGSLGSSIGKIEDVILNPASGRIDFAVLSYSGTGTQGTTITTGASTTRTTTTSAT